MASPSTTEIRASAKSRPATSLRKSRRWLVRAVSVLLAACCALVWWMYTEKSRHRAEGGSKPTAASAEPESAATQVEVIRPHQGGLKRTTRQPGTAHAFDYA